MSIKLNRKGAGLAGEDRVKENQNLEMIEQEFNSLDSIKEDSAAAKLSALEALAKADAADSLSKNVQTQLNTIVVEGDSSPQATQASVGARGEDYGGNLKARLDAEFNETSAQLAETVKKTETGVLNLNVFDEPTRAAIQGIEPGTINAVLGDGNVKPTNTSFFDISRNLFDNASALIDTSISSAGEIITEAGRKLSGYIKVSPGETIANGGAVFRVSYHRADNSFISRTGSPLANSFQVTSDPQVAYMRISPPTSISDGLMVNRGATPLPFEAYYERVESKYLPNILGETAINGLIDTKVDPKIANELAPVNAKLTELENTLDTFGIKPHYLKVHSDGDFTVYMDIGNNEFASTRFKRDTVEDFIKMYEQSIQTLVAGAQDITNESNYDSVSNGSMLATTTNNHYTTTIGTTVTKTFTGKDISQRFYRRYDGGMWRLSIDGAFIKNISVKKNDTGSGETFTEVLATGLANTEHVVTLEFIGNDPANPATTSDGVTPVTPRGWIHHNTTGDATKTSFVIVQTVTNATSFTKKFDLSQGFSNKEHAFEVAVDAQSTAQWFPAHSGIGTTNTGATGRQVLTVDGVELSLFQASNFIRFNKINFIQIMECKLTSDTETRALLKLVTTAEGNKVREYLDMKFLLQSYIRNGYVAQMPMLNNYLSRIKTDAHEVVDADTVNLGTNTYFPTTAVNEFIATSDFSNKENYYMKVTIHKQSDEFKDLYLQHRTGDPLTGIQKLYPKAYSQEVIQVGRVIHWEFDYEIDRLQNANLIYS